MRSFSPQILPEYRFTPNRRSFEKLDTPNTPVYHRIHGLFRRHTGGARGPHPQSHSLSPRRFVMSDYAIIFQILGVLLALFFIFLTVMNFKTWRWLHALTTFAVFCAVATFMVYAALVMKTRLAWEESHAKFKESYEKEARNVEKVINGDPAEQASVNTSLTYYRNELARALVDRGRVWRHCIPAGAMDGTVTVTM